MKHIFLFVSVLLLMSCGNKKKDSIHLEDYENNDSSEYMAEPGIFDQSETASDSTAVDSVATDSSASRKEPSGNSGDSKKDSVK